jgi:DNA polymerase elongation subunit (family B)
MMGPQCCDDPVEFEELLNRWQARVMNEPLSLSEVVQSKRLSRPLDQYAGGTKKDGTAKRQLPHVELAKELAAKGEDAGDGAKIDYYIFDASTKPVHYKLAAEWADDVDRYGLWDNQIVKPTLRVLEHAFPERDWKLWARSRPRKTRAKKVA